MNGQTDAIGALQSWYLEQCDGDWEHLYGIQIETLDNPGWLLKIDTTGSHSELQDAPSVLTERSETDWISIKIEGGTFEGACGPTNLSELIFEFFNLAAV